MRFCRKQLLLANDSNWFCGLNPTICSTTFTLTSRGTYSRTQELLAFPQARWLGRTGLRERGSCRPRPASTSELAERIKLRSAFNVKLADAKGKQAEARLIFSDDNKHVAVQVADRCFVTVVGHQNASTA